MFMVLLTLSAAILILSAACGWWMLSLSYKEGLPILAVIMMRGTVVLMVPVSGIVIYAMWKSELANRRRGNDRARPGFEE